MWLASNWRWTDVYVRIGTGTLLSFGSNQGRVGLSYYRGWPQAPRIRYYSDSRIDATTPRIVLSKITGPVLAMNGFGGAYSSQWDWGPFHGSVGKVCVVIKSDGAADWNAPMLATLESLGSRQLSQPMQFWAVSVPLWLLVVVFGILPGIRVIRMIFARIKRHGAQQKGHCTQCGYDLRASKDRCPECGTQIRQTQGVSQ
jgi:hypothetical protein